MGMYVLFFWLGEGCTKEMDREKGEKRERDLVCTTEMSINMVRIYLGTVVRSE